MPKLSSRNLVGGANKGAVLIVRDVSSPIVKNKKSPDYGKHPPMVGADGVTPATITLLGLDSDVAKALHRENRARWQNLAIDSQVSGGVKESITAEDVAIQEEQDLDLHVALTRDWWEWIDEDDEPLPCTPDNVRAVYLQDPSVLEQVQAFVRERSNFFASSRASATLSRTG